MKKTNSVKTVEYSKCEHAGRVLVSHRSNVKVPKINKNLLITKATKNRIDLAIAGSQTTGIEMLIHFALDTMEQGGFGLEGGRIKEIKDEDE